MTREPTEVPPPQDQPAHAPRFGRALRRAVTDSYDHLGLLAAATFLWGVVIGLPTAGAVTIARVSWAWLGAGLVALGAVAAANAGLFHLTHRIAGREPASLLEMARGARELLWPSLRLAVLLAGIGGVILVNSLFYFNVLRAGRLGALIGFVCLYLLGLFCLLSLYAYPLLVIRREKPLAALKKSALLTLDNFAFTVFFALFALALTALVAVPLLTRTPYLAGLSALLALFVCAGFLALLANHTLLELLKKY